MDVQTATATPVHQPPPPSLGNDREPNLAIAGVTKAVCRPCAKTFTWTDTPIANCPDCNGVLIITAATGETATEAIARAAEQLPDRVERQAPQQQRIPGLTVPFNFEAAFRSIMESSAVVDHLNGIAARKHDDASSAKKLAAAEQEKLSRLEREYRDRLSDLETEAALPPADRRARGCAWEAKTGTPCAICRDDTGDGAPNTDLVHLAGALLAAAKIEQATPTQVRLVLAAVLDLLVPEETIEVWTSEDLVALAYWLARVATDQALKADTASDDRPEILGRAHVIAEAGSCRLCGTLLHPLAASFELEAFTPGMLVGTDCPGESVMNLQALLSAAGAVVPATAIEGWTPALRDEAEAWAREQLEANEHAGVGHSVSVRWPDHVDAAVFPDVKEPARRPRKRHATTAAVQQAGRRQARTKDTKVRGRKHGRR